MKLTLIILFMSSFLHSQECKQPVVQSPVNELYSIGSGKSCYPLNSESWDETMKNPCDCIRQQGLNSKLSMKVIEHGNIEKLNRVNDRIEKKIA